MGKKSKIDIDENLNYIQQVESEFYPTDPRVPLPAQYEDERGLIRNILFMEKGIKSVAIITSRKGTERSNHWHKTDWHFLYVLSGEMKYSVRDIGEKDFAKHLIVKPGEMVFTPPMKVHRTIFTKDTVLLSCAKNVRSYKLHEEDIVREKF